MERQLASLVVPQRERQFYELSEEIQKSTEVLHKVIDELAEVIEPCLLPENTNVAIEAQGKPIPPQSSISAWAEQRLAAIRGAIKRLEALKDRCTL